MVSGSWNFFGTTGGKSGTRVEVHHPVENNIDSYSSSGELFAEASSFDSGLAQTAVGILRCESSKMC